MLAGPVIVALDLLSDSLRVLTRVASLPRDGATLHLVHVVPASLDETRRVEAIRHARTQLASLADEAKLGTVELHLDVGAPAERIGGLAAELDASLVVLGHGAARVRDHFIGSTAERVLRATCRPVLVVRGAVEGHYRAPLLALDLDEAAPRALHTVLDLLPPPRPELGVVHAYDVPYFTLSHSDLRSPDALAHRRGLRNVARDALSRMLVETLTARALSHDDDAPVTWRLHLRHGSPRHQILRVTRAKHADLLVLGTRGREGLALLFLGSVAGDVLRESPCDVLLVPPPSERRP